MFRRVIMPNNATEVGGGGGGGRFVGRYKGRKRECFWLDIWSGSVFKKH